MTKYTPAPWSLPHFAEPETNCQCGYVLTGEGMGAVCTVYASGEGDDWQKHGDNPKFAEAVANAHLIAAAPDLLEALGPFAKLGAIILSEAPADAKTVMLFTSCTGEKFSMTLAQLRAAQAAVAKATGTAS